MPEKRSGSAPYLRSRETWPVPKRPTVAPKLLEPSGSPASELGMQLEERGGPEGAEAAYRRADKRGDATGGYNVGGLLAERGDIAAAQAAYLRAARDGPTEVAESARMALLDLGASAGAGERRGGVSLADRSRRRGS